MENVRSAVCCLCQHFFGLSVYDRAGIRQHHNRYVFDNPGLDGVGGLNNNRWKKNLFLSLLFSLYGHTSLVAWDTTGGIDYNRCAYISASYFEFQNFLEIKRLDDGE